MRLLIMVCLIMGLVGCDMPRCVRQECHDVTVFTPVNVGKVMVVMPHQVMQCACVEYERTVPAAQPDAGADGAVPVERASR